MQEATDKKRKCVYSLETLSSLEPPGYISELENSQIADFQGGMKIDRKEAILDNEFEGVWF